MQLAGCLTRHKMVLAQRLLIAKAAGFRGDVQEHVTTHHTHSTGNYCPECLHLSFDSKQNLNQVSNRDYEGEVI